MKNKKYKQIVSDYKHSLRPMGVYQIKNTVNGRILIGSSLNLEGIINRQRFTLNWGGHINKDLQKEWKEYGEENFTFEILERIKPREDMPASSGVLNQYKDELDLLEQKWLEKMQPYGDIGYHKKTP